MTAEYEAHRIAAGVPKGGVDFAYGDAFVQDSNLDWLGGVDFKKGCYVGQEVVARVHHRKSREEAHRASSASRARPRRPAREIAAGGAALGHVGSTAGSEGLAMVRIDRLEDAQPRRAPIVAAGRNADRRSRRRADRPMAADDKIRCVWPGADPLYLAYHDEEWGVPERDDRALYEKLILDGFQAGLSWITILRKREAFRAAFDRFEPEKIARYTPKKVETLMQDAGIVRNRAKIEAAVVSARAWLKIQEEGPGFSNYLWGFVDGAPMQNAFRHSAEIPGADRAFRAACRRI